jgi:hypothetical protein
VHPRTSQFLMFTSSRKPPETWIAAAALLALLPHPGCACPLFDMLSACLHKAGLKLKPYTHQYNYMTIFVPRPAPQGRTAFCSPSCPPMLQEGLQPEITEGLVTSWRSRAVGLFQ